jgi:hypothetical protein
VLSDTYEDVLKAENRSIAVVARRLAFVRPLAVDFVYISRVRHASVGTQGALVCCVASPTVLAVRPLVAAISACPAFARLQLRSVGCRT